ncbi:hypothetical protein K504DRAFT_490001 [Pleomassaria siparia CBS 279.74]|uniref:Uncharacterized protein n=1 Tax=Pleomassaria siparia CBS 279.74 TaxID=1314801 RepID=A0A6G1KDY2_9PLEO|nr:hypothetical protein K504DRAFT_490001 [Pleomassaria siparia CBS 279.74]
MSPPATRRSTRLSTQNSQQVYDAKSAGPSRIEKGIDQTRATKTKQVKNQRVQEWLQDSDPSSFPPSSASSTKEIDAQAAQVHFGDDEDEDEDEDESETDSDSDMEGEEESVDGEEDVELTGDNFEFRASHDLRRVSLDSRLDGDNERYLIDGFVVRDYEDSEDEVDDDADWMESQTARSRRSRDTSTLSRKSSSARRRRSSSRSTVPSLAAIVEEFTGETVEKVTTGERFPAAQPPCDASEIAEEIMDAISMFSRRVNRNRAPLVFVLSAATQADSEVREALDEAVGRNLGRSLPSFGDTESWIIGPER